MAETVDSEPTVEFLGEFKGKFRVRHAQGYDRTGFMLADDKGTFLLLLPGDFNVAENDMVYVSTQIFKEVEGAKS